MAKKRLNVELDLEDYEKLKYWSDIKEVSLSDYVRDSLEMSYRYHCGDFNLPDVTIGRINQLIDIVGILSNDINNLQEITVAGFDSLTGLTRGENYLLEESWGN